MLVDDHAALWYNYTDDGSFSVLEIINGTIRTMFNSIIMNSLYDPSLLTSSSSLTTEEHNDNAFLSYEGISDAQRLLLTRAMQKVDARNNSAVPPAETVPEQLQAKDCTSADCTKATSSRVEEEE